MQIEYHWADLSSSGSTFLMQVWPMSFGLWLVPMCMSRSRTGGGGSFTGNSTCKWETVLAKVCRHIFTWATVYILGEYSLKINQYIFNNLPKHIKQQKQREKQANKELNKLTHKKSVNTDEHNLNKRRKL